MRIFVFHFPCQLFLGTIYGNQQGIYCTIQTSNYMIGTWIIHSMQFRSAFSFLPVSNDCSCLLFFGRSMKAILPYFQHRKLEPFDRLAILIALLFLFAGSLQQHSLPNYKHWTNPAFQRWLRRDINSLFPNVG